jgi:NADH dehydrogenase
VRPTAVADVAQIIAASLTEDRLTRETIAVVGPEEMTLSEAVRRVAEVVGKRPLTFRMPVWFHRAFAWACERTMRVPLVSTAQVRMLAEGLTEPLPPTPFVAKIWRRARCSRRSRFARDCPKRSPSVFPISVAARAKSP